MPTPPCGARHPYADCSCALSPGHHDAHEAWSGLVRLVWVGFGRRSA